MLEQFFQISRRLCPFLFASAKDSETDSRRISLITLRIIVSGYVFALCGGGINALWWGSASLATGGFIGFLFGIPKVDQESSTPSQSDTGLNSYSQRVNTNLEQISDWITKIIVGFGLIQMQKIPDAFQALSNYVTSGSKISPSFAGSLILFFTIIGFFVGYLQTRLYLSAAFSRADKRTFQTGIQHLRDTTEEELDVHLAKEISDIIDVSPASAITIAYRNFDNSLHKATERVGLPIQKRTMESYRQLAKHGHFNRAQVELAEQLRQLRNIAVHEGDKSVRKIDAEIYIRNAARLTKEIELLGQQLDTETSMDLKEDLQDGLTIPKRE